MKLKPECKKTAFIHQAQFILHSPSHYFFHRDDGGLYPIFPYPTNLSVRSPFPRKYTNI